MLIMLAQRRGPFSDSRAAAERLRYFIASKVSCQVGRDVHSSPRGVGGLHKISQGLLEPNRQRPMKFIRDVIRKPLIHSFSTVGDIDLTDVVDNMSDHRTAVIRASLDKVHTLGWTQDAIVAAVLELQKQEHSNYNISMAGLCTPSDLISYCMDDWNNQLERYISNMIENNDDNTSQTQHRSRSNQKEHHNPQKHAKKDRLYDAYKFRLSLIVPFLMSGTWHEAMAKGLVQNTLTTHSQVHRVVELLTILGAIDDRKNENDTTIAESVTKAGHQALLGSIYVSTELHMLTDTSPDYRDSWAFLQARVDDYYDCVNHGSMQGTLNQLIQSLSASAMAIGSSRAASSNPFSSFLQGPVVPAATAVVSSLLDGAASILLTPTQQRQWKNATSNMEMSVPFGEDFRNINGPPAPKGRVFGTSPEDYNPKAKTTKTSGTESTK